MSWEEIDDSLLGCGALQKPRTTYLHHKQIILLGLAKLSRLHLIDSGLELTNAEKEEAIIIQKVFLN